jgi:hypothetical protein
VEDDTTTECGLKRSTESVGVRGMTVGLWQKSERRICAYTGQPSTSFNYGFGGYGSYSCTSGVGYCSLSGTVTLTLPLPANSNLLFYGYPMFCVSSPASHAFASSLVFVH